MRQWLVWLIDVLFVVTVSLFLYVCVTEFVIQPFEVVGQSMEPTLYEGERHFVWKLGTIDRFDLVVLKDPDGSGDHYIKRVIGLPGDRLEYVDSQLWINDQLMTEPIDVVTADFSLLNTLGVEQLGEDEYFVLGDNRDHSRDSREFGAVFREEIIGQVILLKGRKSYYGTFDPLVSWTYGQG